MQWRRLRQLQVTWRRLRQLSTGQQVIVTTIGGRQSPMRLPRLFKVAQVKWRRLRQGLAPQMLFGVHAAIDTLFGVHTQVIRAQVDPRTTASATAICVVDHETPASLCNCRQVCG